jgi:hypothetical protein
MASPHQSIDRVGGWLSVICAVHCAVIPVAVLLAALGVPVAAELAVFDDGRFELGFSLIAVVMVAVSLGLGTRGAKVDRRPTRLGFGLGLGLIAGSRVAPGPEWLAHLVLVAGALLLAYTHRRSLQAARACCAGPVTQASAALLP